MEVLTTALHGVPVLKVIGDVDHLSAMALDTAVQDAIGAHGLRVLIDLRECPYLDSGGLSVLLFTFRQLRRNGWIGVVAPNHNIVRLFEIVGLAGDPHFRVFANSEEALGALEG